MRGFALRAAVLGFGLTIFAGCPGPEVSECSDCGQVRCEGTQVVECDCYDDYPNGGYGQRLLVVEDCALTATTCTVLVEGEGRNPSHPSYVQGEAVCLDPCTTPGAAECREVGGASSWFACAARESSQPELRSAVEDWVATGATEAPVPGQLTAWQDSGLACVACASSCACADGTVCTAGFCLPGEAPDTLACCGRERGTVCPVGGACEAADGSSGTCATAPACAACAVDEDCASGGCFDTGAPDGMVCFESATVADQATPRCRDAQAIWLEDACGRWLELVQTCGERERCEGDACVHLDPDLEVTPTLLDFGAVALGQSLTLTLSVGNLGTWLLTVDEVVVDAAVAAHYGVVPSQLSVEVDTIEQIEVTFAPTEAGAHNARLTLHSDDPDEPALTVLLNGSGVAP